jgi:hypothetical protein
VLLPFWFPLLWCPCSDQQRRFIQRPARRGQYGGHKSVTIGILHTLFALSVSLSFNVPGANLRRELQVGKSHKWHGVKHIQLSSSGFGCVSIGSGTNEGTMEEATVAPVTAISFGLLALVMLGLTLLDHL